MRNLLLASVVSVAFASPAQAALITSTSDPLLTGATLITFDGLSDGTTDPTIQGVSFTGLQTPVQIETSDVCSGACGTLTPPILTNQLDLFFEDGTSFNIFFSGGTSAFGLELFAINSETTLLAFDSANILLGSASFGSSCCGPVFRGLGGFGVDIASARVVTTDYLGADNLRFTAATAVPEPASMLLLGSGLLGAGVRRWRQKRA